MKDKFPNKIIDTELCVIGGGLAGAFTALSAARNGVKVVLIQDRPMLGGNASSEVRMWVRGAQGFFNREAGLIAELEERNIHYNPTLCHSVFDAVLYDMLAENDNITILLNASCLDVKMDNNKIVSVVAWQLTTYSFITVNAKVFADCSGDSILATLTGAEYVHGRESKAKYGESLARDVEDSCTMGMSLILSARETDHPVKFIPPSFANKYYSDDDFSVGNNLAKGVQVRAHNVGTNDDNLWWIELGGEMNSILDADNVRKELLACVFGVWDHIKNHGDHGRENWDLEWVGFLPGKRESRRYVGKYVVTENDLINAGKFYDEVAFGGWPMDDHNPYGMRKNDGDISPSVMIRLDEPYGLPLRALFSKNIENLCFAGRNISVSHVALSSTRVMATCAGLGQALGTAISVAKRVGYIFEKIDYKKVQKILLDDGVYLPHIFKEVNPILKDATINLSEDDKKILLNGRFRPVNHYGENAVRLRKGDCLDICLNKKNFVNRLLISFDPDYSRMSISENPKMRIYAMKLHTGADFKPVKTAETIVKSFKVFADDKLIYETYDNFLSYVRIPFGKDVEQIRIQFIDTNGAENFSLFGIDLI